jgi:hypothetical protein
MNTQILILLKVMEQVQLRGLLLDCLPAYQAQELTPRYGIYFEPNL